MHPSLDAVLDEFADYLALERGRSAHTQRAYLGDLRSLFEFVDQRSPDAGLRTLSLPVLRSWLAAQAAAGAARTTLARRTSAAKTFTAWATRRGLLDTDPAARLQMPKARRTLPAVLRQDQAVDAMLLRPLDQEVGVRRAGSGDLGADAAVRRLQRIVRQAGPIFAHLRVEAVGAARVDAVVDRFDPFHVGAEARPAAEVEREVDAQSACFGNRVDQA